jgi:probable F420-dependent oxidoreductase
VKFGIVLSPLARFGVPVREWVALARRYEDLGYDSVWVHDHLARPADEPDPLPSYEALTVVSALAAGTTRAQIGTCVLVLPLRHPAVTAKMLATADLVSDGRVVLGVGSGQVGAEFAALGLPDRHFQQRGEVTDEYLRAVKEMWLSTGPSSFTGDYVSFDDVGAFPKPRQRPHPKIVVAGNGARVLRRASRHGNGYLCASLEPEVFGQRVTQLRGACRRDRRDPGELEVHLLARVSVAERPLDAGRAPLTGSVEQIWSDLRGYARSGLDHLVLWPGLAGEPESADAATRALDILAAEILPAFAANR